MWKTIIRLGLLSLLLDFSVCQDIIVQTPNGQIKGRQGRTAYGTNYYSFQRIPFAQPPVGNLRFKEPVPANNWDGILDASQGFNAQCVQGSYNPDDQSEDCLYLAVLTPTLPSDGDQTYSTMIYIFGGAFVGGSAYLNGDWLLDHGVIVIGFNYRLGPLGWLSTGDEVIPGNFGLKDQLLAIQWVHDNIALFGGDPEKVTVFGQSSGGISVAYQLLDTKSEGLFQRVIMESGSALMPAGFQRNATEVAFGLGGILDDSFNTNQDSRKLLDYLQTAPVENIVQAAQQYSWRETTETRQIYQGLFWAPVIEADHDSAMITDKMFAQFKNGDFVRVPILAGFNSEEDLYENGDPDTLKNVLTDFDNHLDWLVPSDMQLVDQPTRLNVGEQIRNIYTNGGLLQDSLGRGLRLLSDNSFNKGIVKQAELTGNFVDTYFYQFSYSRSNNPPYDGADSVAHAEELPFIWGGGDVSGWSQNDQNVRERILQVWTDFAKTGNPTPQQTDVMQNIVWPTVSSAGNGSIPYVDLNVDVTVKLNPKGDTLPEWDEIYDSLGFDDFDTY